MFDRDQPRPRDGRRPLGEAQAVELWIARWLRVSRRELCRRYGCDPRRLYEVWEGAKYPDSREKALAEFARAYPALLARIDPGHHRRRPRRSSDAARQLALL